MITYQRRTFLKNVQPQGDRGETGNEKGHVGSNATYEY
jgi:hypothetical protein